MSRFSRFGVAALVFAGSVSAAAVAANNESFHHAVNGAVAGFTDNILMASAMVAGDRHLDDPGMEDGVGKFTTDRIESSSVVTHVEVIGGSGKQRIVLLDPTGRVVYAHDPARNTTVVARNAIIPSITVRDGPQDMAELRVVTAAPAVEVPAELRQALASSDAQRAPRLFYRDEL